MRTSVLLFALSTAAACLPQTRAEQLQYRIAPEQKVAYRVKITVETPAAVETMSGVIRYTGNRKEAKSMTVNFSGGLTKSTKSKSAGRPFRGGFGRPGGPSIPRGPFDEPDFRGLYSSNRLSLVVTPDGEVSSRTQDSQLPYVLGNLDLLVLQPLPDVDGKKEWSVAKGITITSEEKPAFGPRFGPFARNNKEINEAGGERHGYQITKTDGDLLTIKKTYELKSPKPAKGKTGYEMSGTGTWVFNSKVGLSESMEEKMNLKITGGNVDVRYPITVSWSRMTDKQVAEHEAAVAAKQAELKARMEKQKAARKAAGPQPMNSFRKKSIMRQLNSNAIAIRGQLQGLNRIGPTPVVKQDMDLMTRVGVLKAHKDGYVSTAAKQLWVKWEARFKELATDAQKAEVAKANGETVAASDPKMKDAENPFETVVEDDGKGERTWTDSTGKFKIVGTFSKVDGALVILKKPDGALTRIPTARLSKDDQKIVEKLTQK